MPTTLRTRRFVTLSLLAGLLVAAACSPVGRNAVGQCSATKPCATGQTCLPTLLCAPSCTSDAQCAGGGKCAAAGGCVAASGCGGSLDCKAGTVCNAGTCEAPCTATSCLPGERCTSSGRCLPAVDGGTSGGGTGGGAGTGGGTGNTGDGGTNGEVFIEGGPVTCGGELYAATPVQANFLIVLDHSGSMADPVGGAPKWDTAVQAIRTITAQHESQMRFGLQMFSAANPACFVGKVDVPVGDKTATAISQALPAKADGKNTPIGGALHLAASNMGILDAARSNNILLVTDGKENCNGQPVNEVKKLFAAGIKTYVVGFGGEVDATGLSSMATQGGTARSAATKYYQADDPAGLTTAFNAIANGAMNCDLKLSVAPPDATKIYVYVNGVLQARDTSRRNGWDYLSEGNRVLLSGGTCGVLTQNPNAKVTIVYGCPDGTLVPGGPGSICSVADQCGSGRCSGGVCVAPALPDGSACTTNGDCASGQCTAGFCETPNTGKPVGSACKANSECQSNECFNGFCTSPIN